mgnify:FL=1
MKSDRFIIQTISAVLCLFLLIHVTFHSVNLDSNPYQTEVALTYSISDSAEASGVIVREEQVISGQASGGVVSYQQSDGTVVRKGSVIAEVYNSSNDISIRRQIRALEEQIAALSKVSDARSAEYSSTETINRQINAEIDDYIALIHQGQVSDLSDSKAELLYLLSQKDVVMGEAESYASRITQLQTEVDSLNTRLSGSLVQYTSPEIGYFARMTDGYEAVLTPNSINTMTVEQLRTFSREKVVFDNSNLGKIVTDHHWYYAAVLPAADAEKFILGDTVYLNFNMYNITQIPFTVKEVRTDESDPDHCMVLLSTSHMVPELLMVRNPSVQIDFTSYTGLRIPAKAKRYEGQQVGVYVQDGDVVRFKTINIIYENSEFILCGASPDLERPLEIYDQVIVEGTDLSDGKPVG